MAAEPPDVRPVSGRQSFPHIRWLSHLSLVANSNDRPFFTPGASYRVIAVDGIIEAQSSLPGQNFPGVCVALANGIFFFRSNK
jgi:hypothetical protein